MTRPDPNQKLRMTVKPVKDALPTPHMKVFGQYVLLGYNKLFVQIVVDEYTGEEVAESQTFPIFYPTHRKVRSRSKYAPHQGTAECARRLKQIAKGILRVDNGLAV